MQTNKIKAYQDKLVGRLLETTGKVFKNEELELKGQARQNKGVAQGFIADVVAEYHGVKDNVVGSVKEKTGKLLDDEPLELKGRLQKIQAKKGVPKKLITTVAIVINALLSIKVLSKINKTKK